MALDFLCMAFLASAIGRCDGFFAEINGRDHFSRRMMQIALYFTSDVAGTTLPLTESHSAGKEDRERERERYSTQRKRSKVGCPLTALNLHSLSLQLTCV